MAAEPSSVQHKRTSSDAHDAPSRKRPNRQDDDKADSDPEEAITKEEIQGTESLALPPKPRDACTPLPLLKHLLGFHASTMDISPRHKN